MKLSRLQILSFFLLCSFFSPAKDLNLAISYTEFMNEENENYLEMYFSLDARSLEYAQNSEGLWYGGLEVTVTLAKDSNITAADKFRIKLPPTTDTNSLNSQLINQIRLPLNHNKQWLTVELQSLVDADKNTQLKQLITPKLGTRDMCASEIVVLESFRKSEQESGFTKSGYELVPMVTSGSYYFDDSRNELAFYLEVYNTLPALGDSGAYLTRYFLRDFDSQKDLNKFSSFSKKDASEVEPLLASFNIEALPSGNYELIVEVLNKEGQKMLEKSVFFYRQKAIEPLDEDELTDVNIASSFVEQLGNKDSLELFIDYLYPITPDKERQLQKNLMAERDLAMMKRYFYSFWQRLYPLDPASAWQDYKKAVKLVNEEYSSSLRPGYKTDRGRVYLKYGEPSMVEARQMDPSSPPYELWQYNQIRTKYAIPQVNRLFVFADIDRGTQIYEMIHSTAQGEKYSNRWREELGFKYGGRTMDQSGSNYSDQDSFGSRLNNNLILQGTGADQNRRTR